MTIISGYIISEQIYENNHLRIFRGHTIQDQSPVIIKVLKKEIANPVDIFNRRSGYPLPAFDRYVQG